MRTDAWESVVSALGRWSNSGDLTTAGGTRLIGHVPHVAPYAHLHEIYRGLTDSELEQLETKIDRLIPGPYRALLRLSNGVQMFSCTLTLDGFRRSWTRELSVREPFSLITPNTKERPEFTPQDVVYIGGYEDASRLWMRPNDPCVYRSPPDTFGPVLNTWDSLETTLLDEVERLASRFDPAGRPLFPDEPNTPVPQ